ncbi:UvrD-helicase domain-containing protein [Oligoflexia bacterium]|nr:UvrD-helicase domain-containing protein [Oligoflexia bacterium]
MSSAEFNTGLEPELVRASAGTGKTFRLSNRYIALLAAGEKPERILATTFTRKAAGEIQSRVLERLARAALDPCEAKELAGFIGQQDFTSQQAKAVLRRFIKSQHRINICTLDSFCMRIATSFGLELGLLPGWRILEEVEIQKARQEAIRTICGGRDSTDSTELVNIIRLLNKGDYRRSIHVQIEEELSGLHALFTETDKAAWHWLVPPEKLPPNELASLLKQLEDMPVAETKAGTPNKNWMKAKQAALQALNQENWLTFIQAGIASNILKGKDDFSRVPLTDETRTIYAGLIKHAGAVLLNRLADQTQATHALLQMYDEEFSAQKSAARGLLFNDVKTILSNASVMGALDEVYYRLDSRIAHLLLDEFQDTSRLEWLVLEPLADEILAKAQGEHTFCCVGDVKQAIYGWRGGVAEIFSSLESRWRQLKSDPMEKSYRSAQAVIDAVNDIFSDISINEALADGTEAARAWGERFHLHTTAKGDLPGYVKLETAPAPEEGEERSDTPYRAAAELINELATKAPAASIGVLVRRNATVAHVLYELERAGLEIAASGEGGSPLTDSPPVAQLLSLLTLVDHPGDTVACFHVATSPIGMVLDYTEHADDRAAIKVGHAFRRKIYQLGLGAALYELVVAVAPHYGERDLHRLMQLVELAYVYERSIEVRTSTFVDYVRSKKVDDPSASNVRVMTVHQAKGLEFDVVVLPELDRNLTSGPPEKLLLWRPTPLEAPQRVLRYAAEEVRRLDPQLEAMHAQARTAKLEEELSVLYVALTRARHALHMIVQPVKDDSKYPLSAAGILRFALSNGADCESGATLYETGDEAWMHKVPSLLISQTDEVDTVSTLPAVSLAKPKSKRCRALIRQSPSGLEGGIQVQLADRLQLLGSYAAQRGTLVHALFEQIEWIEGSVLTRAALQQVANESGLQFESIAAVVDEFLEMIKAPQIAAALSPSAYKQYDYDELEVCNEYPFALRENDAVLTGIFDRLVVVKKNGQALAAEVLDYKTDHIDVDQEAALAQKVKFYQPQLEAYCRAASQIMQLPLEAVHAKLLFVSAGAVQDLNLIYTPRK